MNRRNGIARVVMTTMVSALLAMASLQAMAAPPQQKDDLFAGTEKFAQGAKSSTEVNLDKNMLGMAGKFVDDGEDKNKADLAKKMDFVIVREYEYDKEGQYNLADVEEFRNRLESSGWSHLVKERSATSSTDVCIKTDNDGKFSELVVIDAEPKELTFVHLKGHMSMEDLMKAGGKYGTPHEAKKDLKVKTKVR